MIIKPLIFLILFTLTVNGFGSVINRDSVYAVLNTTFKPTEKIKLLNLLAELYLKDDPEKSSDFADQALLLSETIGDKSGKAMATFNLGLYSMKKSDYSKAYLMLKEALIDFNELNQDVDYARACLELGKLHKDRYEFEKSLSFLFEAMEIFEENNEMEKLASTYNTIGGSYYDQQIYDIAHEYFNKSIGIWEKMENLNGMASVYVNLGETFRLRNQYSEALEFYQKAIMINKVINRDDILSVVYDNIGNIYLETHQYDTALSYLTKSLKLSSKTGDNKHQVNAGISLGRYYLKTSDPDEAKKYLLKAYRNADNSSNLIGLRDAAYEISKVCAINLNFDSAYLFQKLFKDYNDSLFNTKSTEQITQLEMNLIFENERKINTLKSQKVTFSYFAIASGLVCLLIFFILLWGRLKIKVKHGRLEAENLELQRIKLKNELDYKNRELTTNVMYLVKKNELINSITENLLKVKTLFKKENVGDFDQIILDLQSNIDTGIWKVFEERFRDVHMDFYHSLMEHFPNLTENEKKLCAFIRLNMNTKEIAAILHQNPNTVEVARTRLRKKLNIANKDISLHNFLTNLG